MLALWAVSFRLLACGQLDGLDGARWLLLATVRAAALPPKPGRRRPRGGGRGAPLYSRAASRQGGLLPGFARPRFFCALNTQAPRGSGWGESDGCLRPSCRRARSPPRPPGRATASRSMSLPGWSPPATASAQSAPAGSRPTLTGRLCWSRCPSTSGGTAKCTSQLLSSRCGPVALEGMCKGMWLTQGNKQLRRTHEHWRGGMMMLQAFNGVQ